MRQGRFAEALLAPANVAVFGFEVRGIDFKHIVAGDANAMDAR
jgi:hypothetical protein